LMVVESVVCNYNESQHIYTNIVISNIQTNQEKILLEARLLV